MMLFLVSVALLLLLLQQRASAGRQHDELLRRLVNLDERLGQIEAAGAAQPEPVADAAAPGPVADAGAAEWPAPTSAPRILVPQHEPAVVVPVVLKPRAAKTPREPLLGKLLGGRSIEDVIGENLLAIVGGLLVLVGAVFFLTLAINRGWIGEAGRVSLALAGGAALFGVGLWLAERREGRSIVVRGAWALGSLHGVVTGTGIAVLFLGAVVGTRTYNVLPATAGLLLAIAIGAAASTIAVRWRSQDLAGFGIVGALASPMLVDAPSSSLTLVFMAIALVAAVTVVVRERWPWLLSIALVVTAPQVGTWSFDFHTAGASGSTDVVIVSAVLVAWWLVMLVGALSHELRDATLRLRTSSATVVFATAGAVVLMVQSLLTRLDLVHEVRPHWLIGFAAAHVLLGAGILRTRRQNQTIAVFLTGIGSALLAAGIADQFDGASLVAWWAAEAVALAWLYWLTRDVRAGLLAVTLAALATARTISIDAPPSMFLTPPDDASGPLIALLALTIGFLLAWRLGPVGEQLGVLVRRISSYLSAFSGAYLASIVTVLLVSNESVSVELLPGHDPDAQLALVVLWSLMGLAYAAGGRLLARIELSWTAYMFACGAPLYMLVLHNTRGLDVVVWLAVIAVASAVLARRLTDDCSMMVSAWYVGALVIHVASIEAPLLLVLGTGSEHLPRATAGLAITAIAIAFARMQVDAKEDPDEMGARQLVRMLDLVLASVVTVLASTVVVTALTADVLRTGVVDWSASATDSTAQLAESILWGAMAVLFGWIALLREARHLAWFAAVLATLGALKVLAVGPLDGVPTGAYLAAQVVACAWLFGRAGERGWDQLAMAGAASAGALLVAALAQAPPSHLLYGGQGVATSTLVVLCISIAGIAVARLAASRGTSRAQAAVRWSTVTATASVVYAISILVVGALTSDPPAIEQGAQTALSIVWGTLGVSALVAGLGGRVPHVHELRIGAFILLGMAVVKVVIFDTSQLEAIFRVLAFIGLGLLLLGGAFLDQQLRREDER